MKLLGPAALGRRQRIAGFTSAVPFVQQMNRGSDVVQKSATRPRHGNYGKKTRVSGPMMSARKNENVKVKRGLTITREEIVEQAHSGRAVKLRRWATLSDIGVAEGNDTRVDVWMVITRDRRDYRVRAKVVSEIVRTCDRCAKEYMAASDGRFDVTLRTGDAECSDEEAELVEALEDFGPGVGEVWLGDHVRDGVYLGVPTRSLCSDDCRGVEVRLKPESGSVIYSFEVGRSGLDRRGRLGKKDGGEKLNELKRRLKKDGL